MNIFSLFSSISVRKVNGDYVLYKPILLLYALSKCYLGKERLIVFSKIERDLNDIFDQFFNELDHRNFHYAFGRLENDGVWEIENSSELERSSSGDLMRSELLARRICGGFTREIYTKLHDDKGLLINLINMLLDRYFPAEIHNSLLSKLNMPEEKGQTTRMMISDVSSDGKYNTEICVVDTSRKDIMDTKQNAYIAYLNSLHNLTASGANALAESQALNRFFSEIYEPFPIIEALYKMLRDKQERVVLLTGHAGDGKSTIALDVLKRLRSLPDNECLVTALAEREDILDIDPQVFIVKDMSELTAEQRLDSLMKGFNESGSWLIVSNTGPLINSLADYNDKYNGPGNVESNILEILDRPYVGGDLDSHILKGFNKELIIINITRLDNVAIGSRVLTKMVHHSAWAECNGCEIQTQCPLRLNRAALKDIGSIAEERVRWIYQYLTAYEQRLTLRQMIAHIALSLTGGMGCDEAKASVDIGNNDSSHGINGLERILFSECFFGYRGGKPWQIAEDLRAIALLKRSVFGNPTAVNFERQLLGTGELDGLSVPDVLKDVKQRWLINAIEANGVRWRFSLRRMFYLFGYQSSNVSKHSERFLNVFLHSPMLKKYDSWQNEDNVQLEVQEQRELIQRCLQVLLEVYSGFSAGQLDGHDCLYLTLRRSDCMTIQPTQLVLAKLDKRDFSLGYDKSRRLRTLSYKQGLVELKLTLPLLDYIHARSMGGLGNRLTPIHLAQLEWFRTELLKKYNKPSSDEISLLRSGIDGQVKIYRYVVNEKEQRLERDV